MEKVTVVPCHNSVRLIHPDGESYVVTAGDLSNRECDVTAKLAHWLRDWAEYQCGHKLCEPKHKKS